MNAHASQAPDGAKENESNERYCSIIVKYVVSFGKNLIIFTVKAQQAKWKRKARLSPESSLNRDRLSKANIGEEQKEEGRRRTPPIRILAFSFLISPADPHCLLRIFASDVASLEIN